MPTTIGDRVPIVADLLGGRTDKNDSISKWIASGYRDLAHSIPFETLEETIDDLTVFGQDTLLYPGTARAIKSITLGRPSVNPSSWTPLKKRNKAIINRYDTTKPGVPAIWAPFAQRMYLRPVPNDSYPVIVDYWVKVNVDINADVNTLNETEILLPDDWIEIVDYEAQMRGFMGLLEFDKANAIRMLLHGDPKKPKEPGLIKQRLTRIQAEYENADYGLRPRMVRYTHVR